MNIIIQRLYSPFRRIKRQRIISQGGLVKLCVIDLISSCIIWMNSLPIWGNYVRLQFQKVTQALKEGSAGQARIVVAEDEEIDQMEKEIERLCV